MTQLKRSNVELAKRVFLDRLTVDAQPLAQAAQIDSGPGDFYKYGGTYSPYDLGVGADCSGSSGNVIDLAVNGTKATWARLFSTETFPGPFAGIFRQTSQQDLLSGNYPIKVCIYHGGGGPDSHMNTWIDGWLMESNGTSGTCTLNYGAIPQSSSYWNDFWVFDGSIVEDTDQLQPMGYPRGLDYAGGRLSGATLAANGINFVCRYLTSGGSGLPGKQLLPDEFTDLMNHGIAVVFNFETTATFMLTNSGARDAQTALDYIRTLPGAPARPVVYFSADWDESESQQPTVNKYLADAASVLGGPQYVGIYGAYYACKRALDAGVCKYMWQTEAWSGFGAPYNAPHIDGRVHIVQRNRIGFQNVAGVQCDVNEAHATDFGQCLPAAVQPVTPVSPATPGVILPGKPALMVDQISQIWDQLMLQWPQDNRRTLVDAIASVGKAVGVQGFAPPVPGPPVSKPAATSDQVSQIWDQLRAGWSQLNYHTPVDGLACIGNQLAIPGFTTPPTVSKGKKGSRK